MLLNYHIGHFVLSLFVFWRFGAAGFELCACISNTQRTENRTTNVVILQQSRKLLMMDILMSETF